MGIYSESGDSKPIYKRVWFWIIIVLLIVVIGTSNSSNKKDTYETNNNVEVTVADFSVMTRDEVQAWFDTNKINGSISEEYSNDVAKGNFISQSIGANTVIHEGNKITVVYSLGKEPTTGEKNALKKAQSYSDNQYLSKNRLYQQLTSQYGEGFTASEAQYAIDNVNADWNYNALQKAKSYQTHQNMSKNRIYQQLTSSYGEGFTASEAQYAIDNLD